MNRRRQIANKLVSYHIGDGRVRQHFGKEQEFQVLCVNRAKSHQLEKNFAEAKRFVGKTSFAVTFHSG